MKNSNKKGFTIVELVIVIAVIAILAAVMIPTFSGLIKRANESNDTQLVKNLNSALVADVDGDKTIVGALAAAAEFGYDVAKINASATDNEILWDSVNNVFCYLKDGAVKYIPEFPGKKAVDKDEDYWVISDEISTVYSTYYYGSAEINSETNTSICLSTNGENLNIYAPNASVYHYGEAGDVVVSAVASASYHEFGKVASLKITKGRVVPEAGSEIQVLVVASDDVTVSVSNNDVEIINVVIDSTNASAIVETIKAALKDVVDEDVIQTVPAGDIDNAVSSMKVFADGNGSEANPYIIVNAEQLANISTNFEAGHKYYKVADGVTEINCTGLTRINLNGSFDGNGVVLSNLTDSLFNSVTADSVATVKNFNIRNCYIISNSYYDGIVVRRPQSIDKIIIDNVNVTGYAESVIMSTYVGYTETVGEIEISNCTSSASLVSTGSQVSGFVGNLGTSWGKVTVTDSIFNGAVVSTGSANYLMAHNCDAHLTLKYTDAFAAANSNLHAAYENQNADALACDKYTAKFTKMSTKTLATPNVGEALTVTKDANAVTAKASFVVGVNPGNYTRVCQSEEIDLTDVSGTFTTGVVKLYNVVINDGVHGNELVGDTQYISASFSDGTYNCIVLTVVQYDAVGNITSISTCSTK